MGDILNFVSGFCEGRIRDLEIRHLFLLPFVVSWFAVLLAQAPSNSCKPRFARTCQTRQRRGDGGDRRAQRERERERAKGGKGTGEGGPRWNASGRPRDSHRGCKQSCGAFATRQKTFFPASRLAQVPRRREPDRRTLAEAGTCRSGRNSGDLPRNSRGF